MSHSPGCSAAAGITSQPHGSEGRPCGLSFHATRALPALSGADLGRGGHYMHMHRVQVNCTTAGPQDSTQACVTSGPITLGLHFHVVIGCSECVPAPIPAVAKPSWRTSSVRSSSSNLGSSSSSCWLSCLARQQLPLLPWLESCRLRPATVATVAVDTSKSWALSPPGELAGASCVRCVCGFPASGAGHAMWW